MYVTLKLDDSRCRIHSVSDDGSAGPGTAPGSHGPSGPGVSGPHGNIEIVTNESVWSYHGRWLPDMVQT